MANQKEAMERLQKGGKLINGVICRHDSSLDMSTAKGSLSNKQLASLEAKGVKRFQEGTTTIHTL